MKLLRPDSAILRMVSEEIPVGDINTPSVQALITKFKKFLNTKKNGYGMALPQVGISKRMVLLRYTEGLIRVLINPRIISKSPTKQIFNESCFSVPKRSGDVKRHETITVEYYNQDGLSILNTFTGFYATVVQHEIDHLDGILYIDKMEVYNGF